MDSMNSMCRVCLQYDSESNSFADEVEYDENIKLAIIFQKVTDVEVLDNEEVKPCRLCQDCTERLLNAYEFICCVENAECNIENYLQTEQMRCSEIEIQKVEEDTEIYVSDTEIKDIEVLDEEFQIQQEHSICEEKIEEIASIDNDSVEQSICQRPERRIVDEAVGSRLSKRLLSNQYKCNSCQRTFAKLETLERHKKTAHTVIPPEELANITQATTISETENEKRITCSYCPRIFKRRNNYKRHLTASHLKEVEHLADEEKELFKTKHKYKRRNCPYCGKNFTQASLIVHIRRHTGENPYLCDQCVKAFPRRQDLVLHQRNHTGERPHVCTTCGKSFSRPNKLARHMRVHTGERPYKCTLCQRSFAQSNDLKIHMRRHTGEKPYKCSICFEAFICGAALSTHKRQKNHHSAEDDYKDPFANWRVSKRAINPNNNSVNNMQVKLEEDESQPENLEFIEIIQE